MRALLAVLAAALVAGCADPSEPTAQDEGDRLARLPSPGPGIEFRLLAWDALDLDSTRAVTVLVNVPEEAERMMVLWQADEGVYQGPVTWTGLGDCDSQSGISGQSVTLGRHNGSAGIACPPPPAGPTEVTLQVPAGTIRGTFTVVVAVEGPSDAGVITLPLPSA